MGRKYQIISGDGHLETPPDFVAFLPEKYKDRAPKLITLPDGGGDAWLMEGMPLTYASQNLRGRGKVKFAGQSYFNSDGTRTDGAGDGVQRLHEQDEDGIDAELLFVPVFASRFLEKVSDHDAYLAMVRAYNDWLADYCATERTRLVGVATVAQGDIGAATAELRRAVGEYGFRGVMVRPNLLHGRSLDHPDYEPLWVAAEELDVTVSVHEGTTLNVAQSGDRYETFAWRHACSHPHEQQMGMLSLICGGVLDRHPQLRVVFLESGCGWVPAWLERLDEHTEHWRHATIPLPLEPSEYFARQCFVSTEPDERMLPQVLELLGEDNIVFASDYPHPDGIFPGVVAALSERDDLSDVAKIKILAQNPARCFGLGEA
jgi:predicted TIM-barrel fold metal-dependent hydrolase